MTDRVVVTGVGAVTALAGDAAASWAAVREARGVVASRATGERRLAIDPEELGIGERDAWLLGPPGSALLLAARQAAAQAGLALDPSESDEVGFFAAMGMVDPDIADLRTAVTSSLAADGFALARFFSDGYRDLNPLLPLAMLNNVAFCRVCAALGVRGDNAVLSPAADAGVAAIVEAAAAASAGIAATVLAGGASERVSALSEARARLLEEPGGRAPRPPIAEGAAVLVLEPERRARERDVHPLAALAGWGLACEADPARARAAAIRQATERAGADLRAVDLILPCARSGDGAADPAAAAVERLPVAERLGDLGAGTAAVNAVLATFALAGGAGRGACRAALIEVRGREGRHAALLLTAVE